MAGIEVQVRLKPVQNGAWSASESAIFRNESRFNFNRIHGQKTSNVELFNAIEPFVNAAFGGQNVTVMAYGQTGSGKTHSMLGTDYDKGFIPRAAEALLKLVQSNRDVTLHGSCIEIYNETIRDLLSIDREVTLVDAGANVVIDRTALPLNSASDFLILSTRAERNRKYAGTDMNDRSSRSHTILAFEVRRGQHTRSVINFVDLAGSECTAKSNTAGQQLREGNFINKSLLALGNVVDAIVDGRSHVPYRESKLTRVLRPCLGGKSLAYVLACVNPGAENVTETTAALRFAQRAMKVKTDPTLTLHAPPLIAHTLNGQIAQLVDGLETTEAAAYAKGLESAYTYCRQTVEQIVQAGDREAQTVAADLRQLRVAVLAFEKKKGLDRIAEAQDMAETHSHSMDEVTQSHARESKRLRENERSFAEAEAKLARAESDRARALRSLDRADEILRSRIDEATDRLVTPLMEVEQYELNRRLSLEMEERQVYASIVEDFADGFFVPDVDDSVPAHQLAAKFRMEIQQRRQQVEELEDAAKLANEGLEQFDVGTAAGAMSMAVEERVFELQREEARIEASMRAPTASQQSRRLESTSRRLESTSRRQPTSSPASTVASRNRARVGAARAAAPCSPGTLLRSTLENIRSQFSPNSRRSPAPTTPNKSRARHADPQTPGDVDLDQVVGIAERRRIERERSAKSMSSAAASPSLTRRFRL